MQALSVCYPHYTWMLAAGLPRQDQIWITTEQLVRFHKHEFDELLCKVDFT